MKQSAFIRRFAVDADLVRLAVPLALIWLFVSLTPIPPNDLWWHMAAGRLMVNEGRIIAENRWAYTLPIDYPYVYQSWLSELLMYGAWQLGGVAMLAMLRLIAIFGAYGLIGWHAMRQAGGWAAAISLLIAALAGWSNWTLRPQTLVLPIGAACVVILGEYLQGRLRAAWLSLLPLLILLWVNMHGSFVLGPALIGAALLGLLIDRLAPARATGDDQTTTGRQPSLRALTLTLAASGPAVLANPLGPGIISYLQTMLGNAALQRYFIEWQAPRPSLNPLGVTFWFYLLLLGLAVLMARGRRRPSSVDLLWYGGLAWLALSGIRYVMWFGLLLTPLLATRLALLGKPAVPKGEPSPSGGLLLGMLGLFMIVSLPWFGITRLFAAPGASTLEQSLLGPTNPLAATAWLAANPIEGRFWTDMSYTSYIIWVIPDRQVFADLRVELFPEAVWRDYFAIARGDQTSLELIEQYGISHLMLSRVWQVDLLARLEATPGWCRPYADDQAAIVVRC